jgi:hypothetical protein
MRELGGQSVAAAFGQILHEWILAILECIEQKQKSGAQLSSFFKRITIS